MKPAETLRRVEDFRSSSSDAAILGSYLALRRSRINSSPR